MSGKNMEYVRLNQQGGIVIEIYDGKFNLNHQGWKDLEEAYYYCGKPLSGEKEEKPSIWMFPKFTKIKASDVEQLSHVSDEVIEASFVLMRELLADGRRFEATDMEILDVIHSCETFLRNRRTDEEVAELIGKVTEKNAKRGYYD